MRKVTVTYRLSTEGQKKSLLAGGTGEKDQKILLEVTDEQFSKILNMPKTTITEEGKVIVDVNQKAQFILIDNIITSYEDLIKAIEEHEKKRKAYEEGEKLKREVEREEMERKMRARQLEKEAEEKEKQMWEEEKKAWIEKFGSPRLKKAFEGGYPCTTEYIKERVRMELGEDWIVDEKDEMDWKSPNDFPSEEALDLEKELKEKGYDTRIVWLIDDGVKRSYDDEPFKPCEAIVIRNYKNTYNIVKIIKSTD